jgi:hypothetical protein
MSKPSNDDERFFPMERDQGRVRSIERTILGLIEIQDSILNQQDLLIRATHDLADRLQTLEDKARQRARFRIVKE